MFDVERGGGRIGRFLATTLEPLLTGPGTFVLLRARWPSWADARVQPAAARADRPGHRHGPLGRHDRGRLDAPRRRTARRARRGGKREPTARRRPRRRSPYRSRVRRPPLAVRAPAASSTSPRRAASPVARSARRSGPARRTGLVRSGRLGSAARRSTGAAGLAAGRPPVAPRPSSTPEPPAFKSLQAIDWALPSVELLEVRAPGRRVRPHRSRLQHSGGSRRSC